MGNLGKPMTKSPSLDLWLRVVSFITFIKKIYQCLEDMMVRESNKELYNTQ